MTVKKFISKLNPRQILIHCIASWFFIHAFQTLLYLYYTDLIAITKNADKQELTNILRNNGITTSDLIYFYLWKNTSGFIGLLTAFIISLVISLKRHWFWVNALIVFVVTYLLYKFGWLGWIYLKQFFLYPGQRFNNLTVQFLLNGLLLLTIGLLIFFLKWPNRFIEKKHSKRLTVFPAPSFKNSRSE